MVERAVLVTVEAFDWNCPQHIPERFTVGEIAPPVSALQDDLAALRQENDDLRNQLRAASDTAVRRPGRRCSHPCRSTGG